MSDMDDMDEPFNLQRFVSAQSECYEDVMDELRSGRKQTHWMWFVFPQIAGLGSRSTAVKFAIGSAAEADAYLAHPVLGRRLLDCSETVLTSVDLTATDIFGTPDDLKLCSSMTLFDAVQPREAVFGQLLDRFYAGKRDDRTLQLLNAGIGRS